MVHQKDLVLKMMQDPSVKHRILSLDGGGSWALLQAMILNDLFPRESGHQVLNRFDTVTANSGGSIVAAALAVDMSPQQIVDYFRNDDARGRMFTPTKPGIFSHFKTWLVESLAQKARVGYRYSMAAKQTQLRQVFGGATLGSLGVRPALIITAFDYDTDKGKFFRSKASINAAESRSSDDDVLLADAVNASTNAPVLFFDKPAPVGQARYWDGAVAGFNNPVLVGLTEALSQGHNPAELGVLSIGTGNTNLPVIGRCENEDQGERYLFQTLDTDMTPFEELKDNIAKMSTSIVSEPPTWATFAAYIGAGHTPADRESIRYFRLNPMIQPCYDGHTWTHPAVLSEDDFRRLVDLEMDAVEAEDVALIYKFGLGYLAGQIPNQGIRSRPETLKVEIGYDRYIQAPPPFIGPEAPPETLPGGVT